MRQCGCKKIAPCRYGWKLMGLLVTRVEAVAEEFNSDGR